MFGFGLVGRRWQNVHFSVVIIDKSDCGRAQLASLIPLDLFHMACLELVHGLS